MLDDIAEIGPRLAAYLGTPVASLGMLASGWETTVFEFATEARSPRFPSLPQSRPLVLRFYQGPLADDKGAREYATMSRLAEVGYAVARPYAFEPEHGPLGAPFMLMDRLEGGPLFVTGSFPRTLGVFSLGFIGFARMQARLHRLDHRSCGLGEIPRAFRVEGTAEDQPLLERVLRIIEYRVREGPLPGLRDALRRLTARRTQFREVSRSVVHMDYHPRNVLVRGTRVTGVIDWVNADLGDRHLDVAMTSAILSSTAMEQPRWMRDNIAGNSLRATFASLYIPLYHAMAPLNFARLRYCQAVASLLRLSMLEMMRTRGAETVGFRPEAAGEVTPAVMRLLSRYAARKAGSAVALDLPRSKIAKAERLM